MVEKISAVTLRVANMRASVRFYKDVLGLESPTVAKAHISHRSVQKTGIRF